MASNSYAFNAQNHRVICDMAYQQLTPAVQTNIDQLIAKSPFSQFASACSWPDQIRQEPQHKHTKTWHYINVPRQANSVQESYCAPEGCLLSAIPLMQQRIQKNRHSDWQSLLFLSHFVGDMHQPLHVSYADDRGGNRVHVSYRGKSTNLHSLWDGALLKKEQWPQQSARLLQGISQQQRQQWQQGRVEEWATESLLITQEAYRLLPVSKKINDKYVDYFAPQLEVQLQKASVRLAKLLEQLYI